MRGRAFVAETPIDDPGDDRRNVAALWELAGLKAEAPEAEKGFSMLTAALKKKISTQRAQGARISRRKEEGSRAKSKTSSKSKQARRKSKKSKARRIR